MAKVIFRGSNYYPEILEVRRPVNAPATFEFRLPNEEGELTNVFEPGKTGIMINIDDKNVLFGVIKNVEHQIDEGGASIRVIGEDFLGPCADQTIFRYFMKSDIADIVANIVPSDFDTSDIVKTHVSSLFLAFEDETRLSVLRDLADMARSGSQFGYDFYLSPSKTFHFFPRKSRDSYKRFVYGSDFAMFNYQKDISQLANIIRVYGHGRKYLPSGKELGTEGQASGWGGTGFGSGTPANATGSEVVATGNYSVKFETAATGAGGAWNIYYPTGKNLSYDLRGFDHFRVRLLNATGGLTIKLKTAPSDYFYWEWDRPSAGWREIFVPLDKFKPYGKPRWDEINYVQFDFERMPVGHTLYLDGMYFFGRMFYEASDTQSIQTYGSKVRIIEDWSISNLDEARTVAEALLNQLKDPIERIQFEIVGDAELEPGKLVQLSVPELKVSGHYRVVEVNHVVDDAGFRTRVHCAYEPPKFENMIGRLAKTFTMSAPKRRGIGESTPLDEWKPDVTEEKIAPEAVTAEKIEDLAVVESKIGDQAVTEAKIATSAVTEPKIADAAVGSSKIQVGAIQTNHISTSAIVADKIAAGAVTTEKLAAGAITADKIAAGAITTEKLATSAVTSDKIAASSIEANKIVAGAITTEKISIGGVTVDRTIPTLGVYGGIRQISDPAAAEYSVLSSNYERVFSTEELLGASGLKYALRTVKLEIKATGSFRPTGVVQKDTYVAEAGPNSNHGSEDYLHFCWTDWLERPYVQFELPGLDSENILKAELKLFIQGAGVSDDRVFYARRIVGSWSEYGITWNNQPAVTTSNQSALFFDHTSHPTKLIWDVTDAVKDALNENLDAIGFQIIDASEGSYTNSDDYIFFWSRENPSGIAPRLVIEFVDRAYCRVTCQFGTNPEIEVTEMSTISTDWTGMRWTGEVIGSESKSIKVHFDLKSAYGSGMVYFRNPNVLINTLNYRRDLP